MWRNCESDYLCLSIRWCLVSSAPSQPCLLFIANGLYRRRKRESQHLMNRSGRWSITIKNRYTMVFYQYNIKNVVLWLCRSLRAVSKYEEFLSINDYLIEYWDRMSALLSHAARSLTMMKASTEKLNVMWFGCKK